MKTTLEKLVAFFTREGWTIETDDSSFMDAVLASGYGSGPAVINLVELAKYLEEGDGR